MKSNKYLTDCFLFAAGSSTLKLLLSFAVGGLLGDIFLHLLPEAWANDVKNGEYCTSRRDCNKT